MRIAGLAAAIGLLVLACDSGSNSPVAPDQGPMFSANGHGAVVLSVSGSGSFFVGDWRTFAFTARQYADGTVVGQWERIRRQDGNAADSKSHGVVTCISTRVEVHPTTGAETYFTWIGGYATSGLYSEPPNNETAFRVVDNGQGANSDPDQMSLEYVGASPGFAVDYCLNRPLEPEPLFDLEAGNIQHHMNLKHKP